jgi:hypothetical protein
MSGDPEQEYFADGITEDISRLRWLFVIARNSSFSYKGKVVDVRVIARELGVRKLTKHDNAAAQELLKKAITIDPSYAQAYSLLAFSLSLDNSWGWQPSQSVLGPAWDALDVGGARALTRGVPKDYPDPIVWPFARHKMPLRSFKMLSRSIRTSRSPIRTSG